MTVANLIAAIEDAVPDADIDLLRTALTVLGDGDQNLWVILSSASRRALSHIPRAAWKDAVKMAFTMIAVSSVAHYGHAGIYELFELGLADHVPSVSIRPNASAAHKHMVDCVIAAWGALAEAAQKLDANADTG